MTAPESTETTGKSSRGWRKGYAARWAALVESASYQIHLEIHNRWRSNYNPLRSLTIRRAATLLEEGERGAYAELQWLYRLVEKRDAVLAPLVDRRTGAIKKLEWDIRIPDDLDDADTAIAKSQEESLRRAYKKIKHFGKTLEFLALASFRGFAHVEKLSDPVSGHIVRLRPVEQWFWVRDGHDGSWQLNAKATMGTVKGDEVDPYNFLIREVDRPINEVAIIVFVRKSLSQKDWDAFIETFGVPAIFIVMPEGIPSEKEEDYREWVEEVTGAARGALPAGADVKTVDNGARGQNPFKQHLDYQDAQLVMRATGGMLTALAANTGLNSNQADVQERVFDDLALAEAQEISELFQDCLDPELLLQEGHGHEPQLAYFVLTPHEETDSGEVVKEVKDLSAAGFLVDPAQVEEKTGYKVTLKPDGGASVPGEVETTLSTEDDPEVSPGAIAPATATDDEVQEFLQAGYELLQTARTEDAGRLREDLLMVFQLGDGEILEGLEALRGRLADYVEDTAAAERAWERIYTAALVAEETEDDE